MAFLSFLALAELDAWWQGDARASLALGAVFAGLCWQTKNEGALFLAAALGAGALQAAAFRRHRHGRSIAALAALAAIALAVALPSILVARGLPNFYDEDYGGALSLGARPGRRGAPAARRGQPQGDRPEWRGMGQFWIVYPVAAAFGLRRRLRDANAFADAAIFLYVACVLAVFGLTPLHVDFHMKTALPRLLTQITRSPSIAWPVRARSLGTPFAERPRTAWKFRNNNPRIGANGRESVKSIAFDKSFPVIQPRQGRMPSARQVTGGIRVGRHNKSRQGRMQFTLNFCQSL